MPRSTNGVYIRTKNDALSPSLSCKEPSSTVNTNQAQELAPRLLPRLKAAQHAAGNGTARGLLDTSHNHAQVAALHDNRDTLGLEDLHDSIGHLLGQALLDLQSAREQVGNARQLANSNHGVAGDVADMHLAREGHQVVLAHAKDLNVLDDHHFVMALLEDGPVDDVAHVLLVALGEIEHGLGVTLGRGEETLTVGVFAEAFEKGADGALHLVQTLLLLGFGLLQTLARAPRRAT